MSAVADAASLNEQSERSESASAISSQIAKSHVCSTCSKPFARSEHLRRHKLIHSNARMFVCGRCGKGFPRKDALQRHVLTHQLRGPNLLEKGARACFTCAAAKVRCSGDVPTCSRCRERSPASCCYPGSSISVAPNDDPALVANNSPMQIQQMSREAADSQTIIDTFQQPSFASTLAGVGPSLQQPAVTSFDESYWDSNILSAINWLSEDFNVGHSDELFADAAGDLPFALLPQSDGAVHSQAHIEGPAHTIPTPRQSHYSTSPEASWTHLPLSAPTHSSVDTLQTEVTKDYTPDEGEFYVDGKAARLPRSKRHQTALSSPMTTISSHQTFSLQIDMSVSISQHVDTHITEEMYHQLVNAFKLMCVSTAAAHPSYSPGEAIQLSVPFSFKATFAPNIAPKQVFNHLTDLYYEHFQPVLPIIHITSFRNLDWRLILVIGALGARYSSFEGANHLIASLNEFVRRLILGAAEDNTWLPIGSLLRAQVNLLHSISVLYSEGSSSEMARTRMCEHVSDMTLLTRRLEGRSDASVVMEKWSHWKQQEEIRRILHAIWLLDWMLSMHFDMLPYLRLQDAMVQLPCHEKLWAADSAGEWQGMMESYPSEGSLNDVLQRIYIEKHLESHTGEFSRILLIHGLFRRLWEVGVYLEEPLSHWQPTAKKQSLDTVSVQLPPWLPSIPTFAQWRNSACDCLDLLHWSANATIGLAAGIEHPTVLHLHLARVVLLTPYKHIVRLAQQLAGVSAESSEVSFTSDKQIIRRWAVQDQYKARLAMIHAGVLFWHVRRHSALGFYEPWSLTAAILALWAFSAFSDQQRQQESDQNRSSNNSATTVEFIDPDTDEPACDIILLDRPTDDELVQQFVRIGYKMKAYMTGVGNLYEKGGAERVLIHGRELLCALTRWSTAKYWIRVLDRLIAVSKQQHDQQSAKDVVIACDDAICV